MTAIYWKDLKNYIYSPIGCAFISFIVCVCGIYTSAYNLSYSSADFEHTVSSMVVLMVLAIPLLTMNSFASERQHKTDQMLFSAPVSLPRLIIGKYLAMLTILGIALLCISIYPLLLSRYGNVNLLSAYTAITGLLFLGMLAIAIGMYISCLAESGLIAAIATLAVLLICCLMGSILSFIKVSPFISFLVIFSLGMLLAVLIHKTFKLRALSFAAAGVLGAGVIAVYIVQPALLEGALLSLLSFIALADKMTPFVNGVFDVSILFYHASLSAFFLLLCSQTIEKRRWS